MKPSKLLLAPLLAAAISVHAADAIRFDLDALKASASVQDLLDPSVTLYWGSQPAPAFAEYARPDVHSASSISLSPFGGSRRHCVDAFEKALRSMIVEARSRHYDAIVGLVPAIDGKPSADPTGFSCTPGYKVTTVQLSGSFAMSAESLRLAAELERRSTLQAADGPLRDGTLFLPLAPILESPQAKAILGPQLTVHVGMEAPPYRYRYGPDVYAEDADLGKSTSADACTRAVLNSLQSMVDDAKEKRYDAIIKVRSFIANRFAPQPTDVECQIDKKTANVALQASLAEKN